MPSRRGGARPARMEDTRVSEYTIIDGVAYPIAASAPVVPAAAPAVSTPVAASPFQTIINGKEATQRWPEPLAGYARNAPAGMVQRVVREAAAFESVPGYACDAVTRTLRLGDDTRDVGHGFVVAKPSGSACPTLGCEGKIR